MTTPNTERATEPLTVRFDRATQLTGICRSKLYELAAQNKIETVKVGKARLIRMSSLRRLVGEAA